jgi:putative transposase
VFWGYHSRVVAEWLRKNIRLPSEAYRGRRLYFVTICFHNRSRLGANPRIARWLINELQKHAVACEFFVHAYCIMPDHVHFLVAASAETSNLTKFVESYKQATAFAYARKTKSELWQAKYYDRVLRGRDSAEGVAWYIWLNPVRQGLCATPTEYPLLGSFTDVGMKMLRGTAKSDWAPPWKKPADPFKT